LPPKSSINNNDDDNEDDDDNDDNDGEKSDGAAREGWGADPAVGANIASFALLGAMATTNAAAAGRMMLPMIGMIKALILIILKHQTHIS
jgi:hypothetical protein